MRKVITPQRDLFARSVEQIAELPGLELDERDYFRDVYDHLIRISHLIDSYRDLSPAPPTSASRRSQTAHAVVLGDRRRQHARYLRRTSALLPSQAMDLEATPPAHQQPRPPLTKQSWRGLV
jgi:hypothetical protein